MGGQIWNICLSSFNAVKRVKSDVKRVKKSLIFSLNDMHYLPLEKSAKQDQEF